MQRSGCLGFYPSCWHVAPPFFFAAHFLGLPRTTFCVSSVSMSSGITVQQAVLRPRVSWEEASRTLDTGRESIQTFNTDSGGGVCLGGIFPTRPPRLLPDAVELHVAHHGLFPLFRGSLTSGSEPNRTRPNQTDPNLSEPACPVQVKRQTSANHIPLSLPACEGHHRFSVCHQGVSDTVDRVKSFSVVCFDGNSGRDKAPPADLVVSGVTAKILDPGDRPSTKRSFFGTHIIYGHLWNARFFPKFIAGRNQSRSLCRRRSRLAGTPVCTGARGRPKLFRAPVVT